MTVGQLKEPKFAEEVEIPAYEDDDFSPENQLRQMESTLAVLRKQWTEAIRHGQEWRCTLQATNRARQDYGLLATLLISPRENKQCQS